MHTAEPRMSFPSLCLRVFVFSCLVLFPCLISAMTPTVAQAEDTSPSPIDGALLFPDASSNLTVSAPRGDPQITTVRDNGKIIGYLFSTWQLTRSVGYSGMPIDIDIGLGLDGRITGARLVAHQEPILVIGVSTDDLKALVSGMAGVDVTGKSKRLRAASEKTGPDHITGATISSAVIKHTILLAARRVARIKGIIANPGDGASEIVRDRFERRSWSDLRSGGSISHLELSRRDVSEATGGPADSSNGVFLDIYTALLTPATIGRNLVGLRTYHAEMAKLAASEHAILVAANGLYSFKGTSYRRKGVFDRIQIAQGSRTITLRKADYSFVEKLAADGAPEFREIAIFRIPASSGFNGAAPWRLQVLINRAGADGTAHSAVFDLHYRLPESLIIQNAETEAAEPASETSELIQSIWFDNRYEIALLIVMITLLILVLLFHDVLTRSVKIYRFFRIGFLIVTFLIIGLYAKAQISVVNVIAFLKALLGEFQWENFLLSPLSFILWSFVALSLLFWGRGVYCGWLCPFGALQELVNILAKRFRVPQLQIPWPVHERLWPIKYIAFLLIIAVALRSTTDAYLLSEIEPFKTAIVLGFVRKWPYVTYVVILVGVGLFIERFFCRYLCPLGAALAIPAKLKLFEWLKRRPQCGRECRICETRCTVQAINPIGQINPNECIYCLKCQANYHDANTCLTLKRRAMRRAVPMDETTGGQAL